MTEKWHQKLRRGFSITMKDQFGDRMKEYEISESGRKFIPLLPVYARIDGRSFSRFTQGFERPYDLRISRTMIETTKFLVEKTHALIGYTQSDEISLIWHQIDYNSELMFDGKIQKMVSVLAGMASAKFNQLCYEEGGMLRDKALRLTPAFDCRVFQLPNKVEGANAFLWREKDATKNAISMAARHFYPHKELQGQSSSTMQEMIFQKEQNFNDYPAFFKRGTFIKREITERKFTQDELMKIPEKHRPSEDTLVTRSSIIEMDMPVFTKVTNRVQVIFDGADPELS